MQMIPISEEEALKKAEESSAGDVINTAPQYVPEDSDSTRLKKERVRELKKQGRSLSQIADETGVPRSTVYIWSRSSQEERVNAESYAPLKDVPLSPAQTDAQDLARQERALAQAARDRVARLQFEIQEEELNRRLTRTRALTQEEYEVSAQIQNVNPQEESSRAELQELRGRLEKMREERHALELESVASSFRGQLAALEAKIESRQVGQTNWDFYSHVMNTVSPLAKDIFGYVDARFNSLETAARDGLIPLPPLNLDDNTLRELAKAQGRSFEEVKQGFLRPKNGIQNRPQNSPHPTVLPVEVRLFACQACSCEQELDVASIRTEKLAFVPCASCGFLMRTAGLFEEETKVKKNDYRPIS